MLIIKKKVNYPFIYFLKEPRAVAAYQIVTDQYITVAEFSRNFNLEIFEITNPEEFMEFDHEKGKPLEGRGIVLSQKEINLMVQIINDEIQKHKGLRAEAKNGFITPVHIVSSESAAGTLRAGLKRPKHVIGFPDPFSIGPLWKLHQKQGQLYRYEWFYDHINLEYDDDFEFQNRFANVLREIKDIPEQAPIFIWTANNADEQICLRYTLYLLRNQTNDIYLINSTDLYNHYAVLNKGKQAIFYTSQMTPEQIRWIFDYSEKEKPLSAVSKNQYQREWEALSQSKDVLRLWIDSELRPVPEDYYDPIIIKTLKDLQNQQQNKDFILTGALIGKILESENTVILSYLEYRIRHLIYSGMLAIKGVPRSMRHYRVKLK